MQSGAFIGFGCGGQDRAAYLDCGACLRLSHMGLEPRVSGGIRYQIENGVNGFLVSTIEETAARMVQLVKDVGLRTRIGQQARETVRRRFLLTRYLEQYLDLFGAFEAVFRLRYFPGASV